MFAISLLAAFIAQAEPQMLPPQDAPVVQAPGQEPTRLDDIVVEGRRLEEMASEFVGEISAPNNRRGLARWHDGVCVGAANLTSHVAQGLVDRVSKVALDLGVAPGEPGCDPNIMVVATADGAALADAMVKRSPRSFDVGSTQMAQGSRALDAFRTSDAAVRWWTVSMPVNSETGERAIRLAGDIDPATNQPTAPRVGIFAASRLTSQIRDDLYQTLVIVDVERLGHTTFDQLADYVAMVALAQIDAEGETGAFNTVLNIFDDPTATPGLTTWDQAYLHALYGAEQNRVNPNAQKRVVTGLLTRQLREGRDVEP